MAIFQGIDPQNISKYGLKHGIHYGTNVPPFSDPGIPIYGGKIIASPLSDPQLFSSTVKLSVALSSAAPTPNSQGHLEIGFNGFIWGST